MTEHPPRVLVVYATAGGSTAAVAEFIAGLLRSRELTVDLRSVTEDVGIGNYDVVVLGSAIHGRAFLPGAERFVTRHAETLRGLPVWLFSLGIGPSLRGPIGWMLRGLVPPAISKVCRRIEPRDYRAFAGVMSSTGASLMARIALRLCGGRYGDLRDWRAIEAWATGVAAGIARPVTAKGGGR